MRLLAIGIDYCTPDVHQPQRRRHEKSAEKLTRECQTLYPALNRLFAPRRSRHLLLPEVALRVERGHRKEIPQIPEHTIVG
jgi:hypothetical protein